MEQIKERLELKVFSGEENLNTRVYDAIVAAMEPYNMIGHLRDGALVITSGDRVDNMLVSRVISRRTGMSCGIPGGVHAGRAGF